MLIAIATQVANAANYTSSILYPLALPSGYSGAFPTESTQNSAGGQVAGSATASSGNDHAFAWSASAGTGVDLSMNLPSGTVKSYAQGTDGSQQVGYSEATGGANSDQAMLWSGTAGSVVDLNPISLAGFSASEAFGVNTNQQVGYGEGSGTSFNPHAMLWTGTAASAVDLNATGLTSSKAFGTDDSNQVGYGTGPQTGNNPHAMLWSGSAGSLVDLNPGQLSITLSYAYAVSGNQEVGAGSGSGTSSNSHALLWAGTPASVVDLNPTDLSYISSSEADGTNGSQQVGYGFGTPTAGNRHALLWSGTAASAVDLQTLLPAAGAWANSYASSIDASGNVFGVAQGTFNNFTGYFAVEWSQSNSTGPTNIGTGYLDLTSGSLLTLTNEIRQGYNGGLWTGTTGITSSAAAADTNHLTAVGIIQNNQGGTPIYSASNPFEGQSPGASDILLKYTYYGDANLDGKVDGSDYSLIDNGYLQNLTSWYNGDFNYDGVINGSDYTLIDNAFNSQGVQLTADVADVSATIAAQIAGRSTGVPEPTTLTLAALAALPLLSRRYRRAAS